MIIEIGKLESFVEEFMDFNGLSQYYWFDADRGNELEMTRSIYIKFKHYLIIKQAIGENNEKNIYRSRIIKGY